MHSRRPALFVGSSALIALGTACGGTAPPSGGGTGPVSALTIPGDSLHSLASNAAVWSAPRSAERDCTGAARCNWPIFRKRVRVNIYADTGARNVAPNPSSPGGTLIGKLENTGNATESMYGLENGPYDFLLYVFPVAGSANGRWVIERVDKAPPYNHQTVRQGIQVGCNHPTSWQASFAEFRSCADGPPAPPAMRTGAQASPGVRTAGFNPLSIFKAIQLRGLTGEDPAWFTCTSGCCVADLQ